MKVDIQMEKERQESAEIRHGHFLKNFGWLTLGKAGYLLLSFIVTLTVVKYLGPYDFGTINYVDAYVKFAYVIATFGLDAIIVREVATGKHDSNSVVWTATFVRLILGVVLGIGVIGLLFLTDGQDPVIIKIAVLESIFLVFVAFHSFFDYFQAILQSKWNALAEVVAYLGTSLFRVILLINKADVIWFAFANSMDMIIMVIILAVAYFKKKGFHPVFDKAKAKSMISQSWYYMIAGMLAIAFTQIDRIMIEKFLDRNKLGEYSVTTNFISIWYLAASVLSQITIPIIHKTFSSGDRQLYKRRMRQSYAAVLWVNIIFAALVTIFAEPIVRIMYGEDYMGVTGTLKIIVWSYGLATVSLITQAHLTNVKKSGYVIWMCIIGVVTDIALNAVMIPRIGIEGAAIATLVTQVLIQILMPLIIPGMRECGIEMIRAMVLWKVLAKDEWNSIRSAYSSLVSGPDSRLGGDPRKVYTGGWSLACLKRNRQIGQLLFYPYVLGVFGCYSLGLGSDDLLFKLLFVAGIGCIAVKMLLIDEFNAKELAIMAVVAPIIILNMLHNGDRVMFLGFIAIAGAKNVDLRKVFKAGIVIRISLMVYTILTAIFINPSVEDTFARKSLSSFSEVTREGVSALGYSHSNTAFLIGYSAAILIIVVYGEKLRFRHYLAMTAVMSLLFYVFVCRAGFLCWILLMLVIAVYKLIRRGRAKVGFLKLLSLVPVAMCAISIWLSYYATSPENLPLSLGKVIKGTFFGRFQLAQPVIAGLWREILGTGLGVADEWKDIAYVHILHNNGWIISLLFLAVYTATMWKLAKQKKGIEVIILAVWSVYFVAEHPAVSVGQNLTVLLMAGALFTGAEEGVTKVKSISIKALLVELKKHIVVTALIVLVVAAGCAVIGYKGLSKGVSAKDKSKQATWETNVSNYKNTIASLEQQLEVAESELAAQKEYTDNSIYMRLDSQNFYSANVQIALTGEANISGALNAYHMFVTEGEFRSKLAEETGLEDESRFKEVISGYIYSNMYIVNILYDTSEGAEKIRTATEKFLLGQAEALAPTYGVFTVQVTSSEVQNRAESGVLDGQNGKLNSLRGYENTVKDLQNNLQNQKTALANLENEGSGVNLSGGGLLAGGKKSAVVFGVAGLCAGIVLALLIFAFKYLTDDRIHNLKDVREMGLIPLDDKYNAEYAASSLRLQAEKSNISKIAVIVLNNSKDQLNTKQEEYLNSISNGFNDIQVKRLDGELTDTDALKSLAESGAVVLVALQGISKGSKADKIVELCNRYNVPVWGTVVV